MLGTLWGVSALRCLGLQLVRSRSGGAGGLAGRGCPEPRRVEKNMKDVKAVTAALAPVALGLLHWGLRARGMRVCGGSGGIRGVRAAS